MQAVFFSETSDEVHCPSVLSFELFGFDSVVKMLIWDFPIINYAFFCVCKLLQILLTGIAQSVQRLATGWTVRGSKPDGAIFTSSVQTDLGHTQRHKMCTG